MRFLIAVIVMAGAFAASPPSGPAKVCAKTITADYVARKEYKYMFTVALKGKVTWSVSNKKIIKIFEHKDNVCKFLALKDGKATLTAKSKNGKDKCKFKITVKSGDAFVKAWCKQWVKDNITKKMDFKKKLIAASAYVVSTNFQYGNTSKPEDVITSGVGNCISGGKLVAAMCEAMGYKAKVRFAAKDDMSRYPNGVIFMKQHYNVEVTVKGKKYYIDGTPGSMGVYLCTKRKQLFWGFSVKDQIVSPEEFMDIPPEMLF